MTEKAKQIIESVTTFTQRDVKCSGGFTEWVSKSEFLFIVEQLCKENEWIPIKDIKHSIVPILLKNENDKSIWSSEKYCIALTNVDEGEICINSLNGEEDFSATHWRPIN